MNVDDVMTAGVATCRASDSVSCAAAVLWERRCGCLPIVDDRGAPVGILTDRDVCMAAYAQARRLDDIPIASAMSRPVWTCAASASVEEAEDTMMARAVRRLVVVDPAGRVVGIVSLDDIARAGAAWDGKGDIDLERVAVTLGEISRRTTRSDEETPGDRGEDGEIGEFVRNSLAALESARREIRADLHLAGNEARARWRRLEARLGAVERHAREAGRDAAGNLAGLLEIVRRFRAQLRETPGPPAEKH
jgi:CBS domain-containing protein